MGLGFALTLALGVFGSTTSGLWLIETRTEMLSMPSGWTVGEITRSIEVSGLPFGSLGSGLPATETRASEPEIT